MAALDDALAEIDLLAVADAVGVLRSGPADVVDRHREQVRAVRQARDRQHRITEVRRLAAPLELEHRRQRDARHQPDAMTRRVANALVALGFDAEYVARTLQIAKKES